MCDRKNCEKIMCDTCVDSIGYVCYDCQNEFKTYLESNGIVCETEGEIKRELKKFMATEKGEFEKGKQMDVNTFFNIHSRQ